jgi:hypothetical protein
MLEERAGKNRAAGRRGEGELSPLLGTAIRLALAFPILILTGCGLESVNYYSPPGFQDRGNFIVLSHDSSNNDPSFLGYDIYYRAYATLAEANSARSNIESATNATTSTPESVLSKMTGELNFKKIYPASDYLKEPMPLLKDDASTYTIYLPKDNPTTNWYYVTNVSPVQIPIVRATGYGDSFNETYKVGDLDYASTNTGVSSAQSVFIVAFAIAYGYDFSKLSSIYSFPASLYQPIGGSNGYTLP